MFDDKPHEECGIIGVFAPNADVAHMAYLGLYALQHRGQEAAGIAVADGKQARIYKGVGLVSHVFGPQDLAALTGNYAIGHTRYSTTGSSILQNAQPFLVETRHGPVAVAHNGNLVNTAELRRDLLRQGVEFTSSSDSEVMIRMIANAPGDTWEARLLQVMPKWRGAYSLVVLTLEGVFAVRDPWGFRPLTVGRLPSGGHIAASESGALATLGCEAIREVKPGEVITLSNSALRVRQALRPAIPLARCTFEHIYFSRPDSYWDGLSVHEVRQKLGAALALEAPVAADVVVAVPDSAVPAAIGYSHESGLPYNNGFIKNSYVGRTFIQPTDSLRKQGVGLKFTVLEENVRGQRVVVVDDSIVRGNTTVQLVKLLRNAGAREVHMRISCPPFAHPCFMGVDLGSYDELIAHRLTNDEIRDEMDVDSLHFLSLDGMMRAIARPTGYCNACFTGVYPLQVEPEQTKTGFEKMIV